MNLMRPPKDLVEITILLGDKQIVVEHAGLLKMSDVESRFWNRHAPN